MTFPRPLPFRAPFFFALVTITGLSARAQTTYTATPNNFYQTTQDNNNPPYAGFYSSGSNLGLYANGGSGGYGTTPQTVGYRTFTTDGTNSASTALPLQVGQSFTIFVAAPGGTVTNSIGFSLNDGTARSGVSDYNTGGRLEYSLTGTDSSAAIYDGIGKHTSGLPGTSDFQAGITYTVTLVSTNEYNFSVSGGTTYNIGTLGGTANSTIDSFSVFNRGYNNPDAVFGSISVANVAAIGLTSNSGETKTVAGIINNNTTTGTNNVQKLGVGTVIVTGNNTYNGTTAVNAGTLLVNNTAGSGTGTGAVTVNNGGTLGGTGTITGTVGVGVSGTINPGSVGTAGTAAAVGTLTTGALTLDGASTSVFDLASSASYDKLVSTGAVALGGTLTVNLGSTVPVGTIFDLVHSNGLLSGTYSGIANGSIYSFGGESFTALYTLTDFELIAAVPEPTTCLGGLLLAGTIACSQRRRWWGLRY